MIQQAIAELVFEEHERRFHFLINKIVPFARIFNGYGPAPTIELYRDAFYTKRTMMRNGIVIRKVVNFPDRLTIVYSLDDSDQVYSRKRLAEARMLSVQQRLGESVQAIDKGWFKSYIQEYGGWVLLQ